MAIVRLIAEGVGPFDKLDLDLSDGKGRPHLGPHILAGVNGSGKTTALRTIGWIFDRGRSGFPLKEWKSSLVSEESRALSLTDSAPRIQAVTSEAFQPQLSSWIRDTLGNVSLEGGRWKDRADSFVWYQSEKPRAPLIAAAYSPSLALRYLPAEARKSLESSDDSALGFQLAVRNETVQAWLGGLMYRRALAKESGDAWEEYDRWLRECESALTGIFDEEVKIEAQRDSQVTPVLKMRGVRLNFSQLPDGVRNLLGWLADFMNRLELSGQRGGILLIDEIDAHLHPRWQRQILPALRKALPEIQIIATTHSPFVITSCPQARVHVLKIGDNGRAHSTKPEDAPFGQSINATLQDVFNVDSRFDAQTESELDAWNNLKRQQAVGHLSAAEKRRLERLTDELSARSEELRLIVGMPREFSASLLQFPKRSRPKAKRQDREKSVH